MRPSPRRAPNRRRDARASARPAIESSVRARQCLARSLVCFLPPTNTPRRTNLDARTTTTMHDRPRGLGARIRFLERARRAGGVSPGRAGHRSRVRAARPGSSRPHQGGRGQSRRNAPPHHASFAASPASKWSNTSWPPWPVCKSTTARCGSTRPKCPAATARACPLSRRWTRRASSNRRRRGRGSSCGTSRDWATTTVGSRPGPPPAAD